MHGRILAAGLLAALAVAAPASAHNLSLSTPSGDLGTFFRFSGRAWQPGGRVFWQYQASPRSAVVTQGGSFRAGRNGAFRFSWTDARPGQTHRMCFIQFDTRFVRAAGLTGAGRRFRRCANFYVAPPSAYYVPNAGVPGDEFVLVALGFPPGRTLQVTVRGPDGPTVGDSFTMTARTRSGFLTSDTLGPIYVPRGGAAFSRRASNSGAGLYTAEIREPGSGLVAYGSARLTG
jgi:hypothetical protein